MPYICPTTGEMALDALPGGQVIVETSPKTLVSITIVKAKSNVTGKEERWEWKEDYELDEKQINQMYAMKSQAKGKQN
jgi:hypothetical protein